MTEAGTLLQRIDDRTWRKLPIELRWKIIPWAIDGDELDHAARLIEATERERGESVKLIELRIRVAAARKDEAELFRLLELRAERYPSTTASVQLARALLERGEVEIAADLYESVRETSSAQQQVQHLGDAIDRATSTPEQIRSRLQRELAADPEGIWPNIFMATWLLDNDRPDAARPLLHKVVLDVIDRKAESQLSRLAELLDRAGDKQIAAELRAQSDAERATRRSDLQAQIEAALETIPASTGDWDLDESIDNFMSTFPPAAPAPPPSVVAEGVSALPSSAPEGVRPVSPGIHSGAAQGGVTPLATELTVAMNGDATDRTETAPSLPDIPLAPHILDILERDFGHSSLRDGQRQVIERVMAGTDTLAIMPTGAGKSLTFQLPAMLLPGVTIVISPLIALMKDQLESLPPRVRERSTVINSTLSLPEIQHRLDAVRSGAIKLVYIAPERFRDHRFLRALQQVSISLAVIDEAHCINLWGSDFRPDYLFIPKALAELGDPPVLALTATATPQMATQIGAGLGRELDLVRVSLFRSNLFYSVENLKNREEKVRRLVEICRKLNGAGIVYVGSRKDAESLAMTLCDRGVQAVAYHAGLEPDTRARNQERFMTGQTRVVCATVAFGMGIDKADVRFIVHFSAPASLEAYAQESGRAGRDGRGARCVLLSTANDGTRLRQFARREEMRIESLRAVYAEIKRAADGEWTVVDPRRIEMALQSDDDDDRIDSRVALGIIEQAGLITRHPDAPVSYTLSHFFGGATPGEQHSAPERFRRWVEDLELPAVVGTAAACSALGISPFELDRYLTEDSSLTVRTGIRGIAVHLLPPPPNIAQRIEQLLERARRDSDRRIDLMMSYIQDREGYCRHVMLARHLGETLKPCGDACDVCTSQVKPASGRPQREQSSRPTLDDAQVVLQAAANLPFGMGKPSLSKLLLGSTESKVQADRSDHFGALRHLTMHAIGSLIDELIEHGYLSNYMKDEYRLIQVTQKGRDVRSVELPGSKIERHSRVATAPTELDPATDAGQRYARLSDWRREQMQLEQKPAYVIASNASLKEMATEPPASIAELALVHGFGAARAERYGEDILRILEP